MKRIISAVLGLTMLACAFSACGNPNEFSDKEKLSLGYTRNSDAEQTYHYTDGAVEAPLAYNNYANLITSFELKMFRNLYADNSNQNLSFSPIGSVLQLSLLLNGAQGDTKDELLMALGTDLDVDLINQCSSYFKSRMENVSKTGTGQRDELSGKLLEESDNEYVRIDNKLLINDSTDVRTSFLQKNADFYGADIYRFDFTASDNKLESLFGRNEHFGLSSLGSGQAMLAVSSVDIADTWLEPYSQAQLKSGIFSGIDTTNNAPYRTETTFMTSSESYIHSDTAEGIIKYTAKNPLKLVLLMPNEEITLSDYIKTFDAAQYMDLLDSFSITEKVNAEIPQFCTGANDTLYLSDTIEKSGLYTLFGENADFGNMAHSAVKLHDVCELQNGFCITAAGLTTKAQSAATLDSSYTVEPKGTGSTEANEKTVSFNRPFIFMLIDNESNIPVYMGCYH